MTVIDDGTRIAPHGEAALDPCHNPQTNDASDDEILTALLEAEAARRAAKLAVGFVDGRWRAGFVVQDDLGELVIELGAYAPTCVEALETLAERVASERPPHGRG